MGKDALKIGANTFAFFTRNPRGGKAKAIDQADVDNLLAIMKEHQFGKLVAHAPYTLNPCSKDPKVRNFAFMAMSEDMERMEYTPCLLYTSKRETITKVILPAAKSGIFSSIILAMGRAIGETMAVLLITGNMAQIPGSPLDPAATLTGTIAMEMSYATPQHQSALFAIGIVLFVIIVILNSIAQAIMRRFGGMTA